MSNYSPKRYTMAEASEVAEQAAHDVTVHLWTILETLQIQNVENDPYYQAKDIDLLWTYMDNQRLVTVAIEIKGDRYDETGNFFLETMSNKGKGTQGCILYTQSDSIFYYFVKTGVLYTLPTKRTQSWFRENMHRFRESRTSTPTYSGGSYITVGRLVPISIVLAEIPGIIVRRVK